MTKTLIAVAISAALAAPLGALADDNATLWPDKAKPAPEQTQQQKKRGTSRADEAMSGNSAAASGSTRPAYDDPSLKPTPPKRPAAAEPSPVERTTGK
ncbi:MAG TPA: hypothetical protein VKC57_12085 [Ktedonobacterales bacterium]|nr:hypothetical protein [Ktedonobacterales bacterium]